MRDIGRLKYASSDGKDGVDNNSNHSNNNKKTTTTTTTTTTTNNSNNNHNDINNNTKFTVINVTICVEAGDFHMIIHLK